MISKKSKRCIIFFFCFLSFPFWMENGLRNSISFGDPELCVIQLRLGVSNTSAKEQNKQTNKEKIKRWKEKIKTFNQTASERKQNAMSFQKKKPRMSSPRAPKLLFQERETKLNLQNFFTRPCPLAIWLKLFNLCYTFMLLAEHKRALCYWSRRTTLFIISSPIQRQLSALMAPLL